ncbi:MAG: HD-GYP domain-containing protein [Inquilinaceae bacterium]
MTIEISDLLQGDALPDARPGRWRILAGMGAGLLVVASLALLVGSLIVDRRADDLTRTLERRLDLLAAGRVELIGAWLDGEARPASQLIDADVFRLFATESDRSGPEGAPAALSAQAPYMVEVLTEFARQNGLRGAYVIDRDGRALLASGGAADLTDGQRLAAQRAIDTGDTVYAPLRAVDRDLVLDVFRPVLAVQSPDPSSEPLPAAAFLMSVNATGAMADFLAPRALSEPGERTVLAQVPADGAATVLTAEAPASLRPLAGVDPPSPGAALPFAVRDAIAADGQAFSVGRAVPNVPWLVVQESAVDAALAPLNQTRALAWTVGVLVVLLVAGVLIAVWFIQVSQHNGALARQFRSLAARIEAQRRLLDGIAETIREQVGLKRRDGTYGYVNTAFAAAVGRPVDQIVGQTDEAVFGHATAGRLEASDRAATETGLPQISEEQVYLNGHHRFLEISKVPLKTGDTVDGVVSVARDVTDLVEQRQRREAAVRSTIGALVKAIELGDPFLIGHSRLVQALSLMVAHRLALPANDVATLEIAANLAQIGKIFVPREILTKPERLSPEEVKVMQTHIHHADKILRDIDFGLPVRQTIQQMYERLDGSGYPNGLTGDDIGVRGRILGACDVLAARIRPRSYRAAIDGASALAVLRDHPSRYDAGIVDALDDALHSPEGEKLLLSSGAKDA